MALLSLRKFAKVTGITVPTVKKLIGKGVIVEDENSGLIDSREILNIYRDKLRKNINHYTIFLWFDIYGHSVDEDIKRIMDNEDAVEVSSFDDICVLFNQSLQEKTMETPELMNKKYKEKVLAEFKLRYEASASSQFHKLGDSPYMGNFLGGNLYDLVKFGKFPQGYEHLEGASIKDYVKASAERSMILANNAMEERFHKICEDLLLYWADSDHELVFKRSDIDKEFFSDIRSSQLRADILNNSRTFMTSRDAKHNTEIFEDLRASFKYSFNSRVLGEYAKKKFYRIIRVGKALSSEDSFRLLDDLRTSNCNEVIVCSSVESANKYLPEAIRFYLFSMQRERQDSVVYIGDSVSNNTVSRRFSVNPASKTAVTENLGVASSVVEKESDSGVVQEKAETKQESVSEAEPLNEKHEPDLKVEASNVKQESDSGVETSPKPAEPVSAQPEVEVIPASSVEVVSEGENARDSIKGLLSSLG